jgi:glutathione S-transferase
MLQLLDEMEEALAEHRWLACEEYSLADVAFTPYLARLEHLNIFGMVSDRNHVAEWYARCKARPSFEAGIKTWENPSYIELMTRRGAEHWPDIQSIMADLRSAA